MDSAAARLRELARYQKAAAPDESAWVMAHTDFAALADEVEQLEAALKAIAEPDALLDANETEESASRGNRPETP